MSNILQIAYTTEGSTDERFLGDIIEKTFESLLFKSDIEIEIADLYTPISQKLNMAQLEQLPSFMTFKQNVRSSLINLNYLYS